jgi:hypothetical protein
VKIELRTTRDGDQVKPRGLVCIAQTKEESELLDQVFGNKVVDGDGLIGKRAAIGLRRQAECRLSDGYGEHYVYIDARPLPDPDKAHQALDVLTRMVTARKAHRDAITARTDAEQNDAPTSELEAVRAREQTAAEFVEFLHQAAEQLSA